MQINLTVTDTHWSAQFVDGCAGLWGLYRGKREDVNRWLAAGRPAMEARWIEVHNIEDELDEQTLRWIQEECPPIALAVMCAEWDGTE